MVTTSGRYYLVITIVLLIDAVISLGFGHGHFQKDQSKVTDKLGLQAKMFEQKLDHFNPNDNRTWAQKYFFNTELINGTRDIAFIRIGGAEGIAVNDVYGGGAFYYYATKFNPILFSLEHRYYGGSLPTNDTSTENMKYLSSQQALGDLEYFIEFMSHHFNLTSDVKWVAFGEGYGGSLAVWARQQYPDLIYAAVSSSAPLLATIDFNEYLPLLSNVYGTANKQCPDLIKEIFRQLQELLDDPEKYKQLNDVLHLCSKLEDSIDKPMDIKTLFYNIIFFLHQVSNKDYISYQPTISIDTVCDKLSDESLGSILERLDSVRYEVYACLEIRFSRFVEFCSDAFHAARYRPWWYQVCNEFGFFPTTTREPYIFGNHLDVNYYIDLCQNVFGPKYNRSFVENAIASTNALYHGLDINVTNTIFIQGSLDPWYPLGVTETQSDDAPAIFIEGGLHCSDVDEPSDDDPLPLKEARAKVEEYLTKWLRN